MEHIDDSLVQTGQVAAGYRQIALKVEMDIDGMVLKAGLHKIKRGQNRLVDGWRIGGALLRGPYKITQVLNNAADTLECVGGAVNIVQLIFLGEFLPLRLPV